MILSDRDIKNLLDTGRLKIQPLEKSQIGPASIDLTLSDEWYLFKQSVCTSQRPVDLKATDFTEAFTRLISKSITLEPGQLCLGKTVEKIALPHDVMGTLEGRSRYARMGVIIHTTSALVQPGSNNHQVLEIVNLAPFPIVLHSGMRISQIVFEQLASPTSKPYAKFGKIARRQ